MGMYSDVVAFRDMDKKFNQMMEMKKFCDLKKFSYPKEVKDYFHKWADESDEEIRHQFLCIDIPPEAIKKVDDESTQGYEIDIQKLPKEVKTIRFTNSW